MSLLAFLKNVQVDTPEEVTKTRSSTKQRNPSPLFMGLRIFKDGSIYPSQSLVDRFNLEYPKVNVEVESNTIVKEDGTADVKVTKTISPIEGMSCGNGFDIFSLRDLPGFKLNADDDNTQVLVIGTTPKDAVKVDIFGRVGYDDSGVPLKSVMEQGSNTFGKERLLPMLKTMYGIELSDATPYVDLKVELDFNIKDLFQGNKDICYVPKVITRGDKAGFPDSVRREYQDYFAVEVVTSSTVTATPEPVEQKDVVVIEDPEPMTDFNESMFAKAEDELDTNEG